MADIELVIKIPDEVYKEIASHTDEDYSFVYLDLDQLEKLDNAIRNGTLLPKGHGNLKDVDKIKALLDLDKADNEIARALKNIIESAPTIVKADKENEQE